MRHRLGLATRTQISVCKLPFPSAGYKHAINRVHKFLWSDVKIDFYHSKNCPSRIVYDHNSNVFYHLRPKNSYCKQYDTNVVAHLKTIGILATPSNDLIIFKTRFKYDLHKFFRYLPRKNQEIFQRFGTRKSTLQHVYQCTEVQNNGGQHSADKTIFQCKWTMKENH